ncbi:peroxidase, partial [Streptomyces violascens]
MSDPRQHEKYEQYEGGSPEAERKVFEEFAQRIVRIQRINQDTGRLPGPDRAFHAKTTVAVDNARVRFRTDLPLSLREGFVQPGAEYPALVRYSNAAGVPAAQAGPEQPGRARRQRLGRHQPPPPDKEKK